MPWSRRFVEPRAAPFERALSQLHAFLRLPCHSERSSESQNGLVGLILLHLAPLGLFPLRLVRAMLGGGVSTATTPAHLVLHLPDQVKVNGAALQIELFHQPGLEVTAVLLRQLFLAVAEKPDAERPVAGLRGVVDS